MSQDVDAPQPVPGVPTDAPQLAALSREALPTYTSLHDEAEWAHRFGRGDKPGHPGLWVLRDGVDDRLIGFVWWDAAMHDDNGITEPWLCLNALAVSPADRGRGYGARLVEQAIASAKAVGAGLFYGLTVPVSVGFWEGQGFTVAEAGDGLSTSAPARRARGLPIHVSVPPDPADRFFLKYLVHPEMMPSGLLPTSWIR